MVVIPAGGNSFTVIQNITFLGNGIGIEIIPIFSGVSVKRRMSVRMRRSVATVKMDRCLHINIVGNPNHEGLALPRFECWSRNTTVVGPYRRFDPWNKLVHGGGNVQAE